MNDNLKDKLLHIGSVKDIYEAENGNHEELIFRFSDRYSVFDWGEMPDHIEGKGESLAYLGRVFFEYLAKPDNWRDWRPKTITLGPKEEEILGRVKKYGIGNHFLGNVEGDPRAFRVKKIKIERPEFKNGKYDYTQYQNKLEDTLIPLEVVFRFGVPEGSSLLTRVDDDSYRRILGLHHRPQIGERFHRPLVEFSTKLESTDRYISYSDAQQMSGLTDMEFARLHGLCTLLGLRLRDFFEEMDIELWDGKFEFAFSRPLEGHLGRDIILIDSIGPDELRLVSKGHKLSKEFLRTYYRNTPWLDAVTKAKTIAKERGIKDWKPIVLEELKVSPDHLNDTYAKAAAALYPCLTNEVADHLKMNRPFKEMGGLQEFHQLLEQI